MLNLLPFNFSLTNVIRNSLSSTIVILIGGAKKIAFTSILALVWFPDIFIEAREQSIEWKKSGDVNTGINERIGAIQDHWAPENLAWFPDYFMGEADTSSAYQRFQTWIADSAINALILDDFVQSGVGVASSDDVVYITTFLMKVQTN